MAGYSSELEEELMEVKAKVTGIEQGTVEILKEMKEDVGMFKERMEKEMKEMKERLKEGGSEKKKKKREEISSSDEEEAEEERKEKKRKVQEQIVESMDDIPEDLRKKMKPHYNPNPSYREKLNPVQLAYFNYMANAMEDTPFSNDTKAQRIISKGTEMNLWKKSFKPEGKCENFSNFLKEKLKTVTKQKKQEEMNRKATLAFKAKIL